MTGHSGFGTEAVKFTLTLERYPDSGDGCSIVHKITDADVELVVNAFTRVLDDIQVDYWHVDVQRSSGAWSYVDGDAIDAALADMWEGTPDQ